MIADSLANYKDYCPTGSLLEKGFLFLKNDKLATLADGRYEIEGSDCFALVQSYNTVPSNEKKWESHKLYLDIQYVVAGEEICSYVPATELIVADDQTPKADLVFYHDKKGVDVLLKAGDFAVFFPQDGHKPGVISVKSENVKKVVVKVRCR